MFSEVRIKLHNNKFFTIIAEGVSDENKYIQSATLNGKELNHAWFAHEDLINEGVLILKWETDKIRCGVSIVHHPLMG